MRATPPERERRQMRVEYIMRFFFVFFIAGGAGDEEDG